MGIESRINRIERMLDDQPCVACATTPRSFVIREPADAEAMRRRLAKHRAECTCGQVFHVKRIVLHEPSIAGSGE
jgi:hypothetical protein